MDKNSYQGYEVQKHRLMMTARMLFQISALCLALQTLFFLLAFRIPRYTVERTVAVPGHPSSWVIRSAERVPGVYREFVWKYPVARLVQSVRFNPTFHIYAPDRLVKWPHDTAGYVSMRAHDIVRSVVIGRFSKGICSLLSSPS